MNITSGLVVNKLLCSVSPANGENLTDKSGWLQTPVAKQRSLGQVFPSLVTTERFIKEEGVMKEQVKDIFNITLCNKVCSI